MMQGNCAGIQMHEKHCNLQAGHGIMNKSYPISFYFLVLPELEFTITILANYSEYSEITLSIFTFAIHH